MPPPPTKKAPPAISRRAIPVPAPVEPVASDEIAALVPSLPPMRSRGPGVAIGLFLAVSAMAFAGYGAWFYVLHPAERSRSARAVTYPAREAPSAERRRSDLAETEPFALQIATAQEHLARGQADVAVQLFKGAFEASGQSSAARSLSAGISTMP